MHRVPGLPPATFRDSHSRGFAAVTDFQLHNAGQLLGEPPQPPPIAIHGALKAPLSPLEVG